jgi:hypothetical protein
MDETTCSTAATEPQLVQSFPRWSLTDWPRARWRGLPSLQLNSGCVEHVCCIAACGGRSPHLPPRPRPLCKPTAAVAVWFCLACLQRNAASPWQRVKPLLPALTPRHTRALHALTLLADELCVRPDAWGLKRASRRVPPCCCDRGLAAALRRCPVRECACASPLWSAMRFVDNAALLCQMAGTPAVMTTR